MYFLAAGGSQQDRADPNPPSDNRPGLANRAASDAAHIIELTNERSQWKSVGKMPYRRVMGDGVVTCNGALR